MRNIYDLTIKELEEYFISIGEKSFRSTQVYDGLYKKRFKEIAVDKDHFKNIQVNDNYKDLSLYNAINSLDEDLRITTILFYFEDMKYKDIAKILNVKEGTIKSRLSRAKEKLYNILKEELHG